MGRVEKQKGIKKVLSGGRRSGGEESLLSETQEKHKVQLLYHTMDKHIKAWTKKWKRNLVNA